MAAVAGLRGTGDWGSEERPKNFREYILFRQPNGDTPLTALMAKTGKESVDDPEFSWWDESVTIVRLQVAGALASGDLIVTVDSTDPGTSAPAADWGVAKHLKPGDILMVEPAEASFLTTEYIEVESVMSDTQFTVRRGACGSTPASIGDDAFLLLVGSNFAEGTSAPPAASRNPTKYSNYCQIFKDTYEATNTAVSTHARTGDILKNDRKRKSFDHARGIEFAMLFGRKSEVTDASTGKPKRTTDGLRRFIPTANTTIFTAAVTMTGATNNFLDAAYKVFDWNTEAGDTRIALCGNQALNELNKMIAKDTNSEVQFGEKIKMYGMNLRELILPQGTLLLRTHPLMNRHSVYGKAMFLVDFSALKWRYLKGRDTTFKDNVQAKDEDNTRGYWLTEAGLEVSSGGLSCGYLGNISAS